MSARWTTAQLKAAKAKKPKGESAGRLTQNVLRAINMQPRCVAWRINNVGVWDAAKGVYRAGNTQKGIADISAILRGRPVWIEVKAGRDRLSMEQQIFGQEVERAGGVYLVVRSTDEFLEWFKNNILEQPKNVEP